MASIFDCDDEFNGCDKQSTTNTGRMQITYDDDLFSFDNNEPMDNVVSSIQNVSITVKNAKNADDVGQCKNGKRKAHSNLELENGRVFKVAKTNLPNIKITSNGNSRNSIITHKKEDEYDQMKLIGSGTYGQVFKARWKVTNDVIAIKRLKCRLNTISTAKNLEFLKREYDNLQLVQNCENIVKLLKGREKQLTKNDLQIDLLFEYCPLDLMKIISDPLIMFHLSEIKNFLRQILIGLDYMHRSMIMHRDIKTENILLTVDGVLKIADFGLSRKLGDPMSFGGMQKYTPNVVTQWYRAPEILLGDLQYNESVDMWSVGCVMGEFWNREPILRGHNEINQIKLISEHCGSITPETWPNVVNLPMFQAIKQLPYNKRMTHKYLKGKLPMVMDDHANNFFDKLFQCNPKKRLTAYAAMNDTFFYTAPLPVKTLKNFMNRALRK